jgi:hypothetical protein
MTPQEEIDNMRNKRWYEVAALVGALWVFGICAAHSETYVETSSGWAIQIPDGWDFQAVPRGFNTAPFDAALNPYGAEGGRFPLYDLWLHLNNCSDGELIISPSNCPPLPKVVPTQNCYTEPVEEVQVEKCPSGELVISPNICDPND